MIILYKKKKFTEITTTIELENFIKQEKIYKFFKKIPDDFLSDIELSIQSTSYLNYKEIKPWLKKILKYPESIYDKKFLKCMGWDINDINNFISEKQKNNSNKLSEKKSIHPELYFSSTTSRIEYWISKGFNFDDAKEKLKERQRTFSKEKCVKKYGDEVGTIKFNDRQQKWINSLNQLPNYNEIQKSKNSYKNVNHDLEEKIIRTSFLELTKNVIVKNINSNSIEEFVDKIINEIDIKRYSDIHPYINSTIIQKKYSKNKNEIKDIFYKKTFYSLNTQIYGTPVYHNGIRFKSLREYELSLLFDKLNIKYQYEGYYPNSKFKYDFYLPESNTYIEYYGMLDNKNINKLNNIQNEYYLKMLQKNNFCIVNNLKLISDIKFSELINKIKEKYENNN